MDWSKESNAIFPLLQVHTSPLAGLVRIVYRRAYGNAGSGTSIRRAEIQGEALKDVWWEMVLVNNGDISCWPLCALEVWTSNS